MTKLLMILALVLGSGLAQAAPTTNCVSEHKFSLRWNEEYGELKVVGPNRNVVVDQDGLTLGPIRAIETMDGVIQQSIVFGDGSNKAFAKIFKAKDGRERMVVLDPSLAGIVFHCF